MVTLAGTSHRGTFRPMRASCNPRAAARFSRSDFVQCLVHFRCDAKTIEDVKRLRAFLANDF